MNDYKDWPPSAMIGVLGYQLEFDPGRIAVLVKPDGSRFKLGVNSYDRAHRLLSRVMRIRGIAP